MTTRFLIAASLLALAACGSKGDGNSAKASGGGLFGGGAVQLQAGQWETTMQVVDYKMPNMPAGMAERMKGTPTTTRSCMTEEEAKGPKPDSFAPGQNGLNCKQEDFVWGNGRIHGKTSCAGANGSGKMAMTMDGTYTPTTMDINLKNETETNHVAASIEMHVTGRRIGECPAGQAGKAG